jgi:hypothetical protein
VNFKQFKYFKIDFQGIIIIVEPSSFIWFKNKTGSILGTLAEIPLMWGSQTFPGPQSLGKKEICREGWDLGFIYPNETSPSLGEKASFQ